MKKNLLFSILCLLCLCTTQIFAQNRTITGTVIDKASGQPIPGVSVKLANSTVGAQTSIDGKYRLSVPADGTLIFSAIGYTRQSVSVAGKTSLDISLESASSELDEVVVTGVGVATKRSQVAIDVAAVDNKNFAGSASNNATQALTGQIAGVQIIQKTSQPGAAPTIQLRSFTTLSQNSQPLILVDGVQTANDILTFIDPTTIDHIEVVKGSAGGMLYGASGGNGVIQIFTKKGSKNGKPTIDVSSKYSNDRIIELNQIVAQKNHWVTDASGNILTASGVPITRSIDGVWTTPAELPFTGAAALTTQNNQAYTVPTYDHVQQSNRVANTFTNSLNIRGGSDKSDYAFSMSNLSQQDVYSNSYNRTNMSLNLGFNLAKGLTLRTNTQMFYTYNNLLNSSRFNAYITPIFIDLKYVSPNTGVYVTKPSATADGNNELAEQFWHQQNSKAPRLLQNFDLNYKFPKFVEIDAKFSEDYRISDGYNYYKNQSGLPQTVFYGTLLGSIADTYTNQRTEYGNVSAFFRTDFQKDFHSRLPIKTTTQLSYDFTNQAYHQYQASGTTLPAFPPYTIASTTTKSSTDELIGNSGPSLIFGYLVNQTIDYGNLFGISGGFRSDYASTFGAGSKPFTFPRGTIFVNPSELFKNHDLVYNWKIRAAFGKAGVQPGAFDRQITLPNGAVGATNPLTQLQLPTTSSNADLAVQTTTELEIGTDVTITPLKNSNWLSSITFSGTYWHRNSDNAEQTAVVSPSAGVTGYLSNLVSLSAKGVDLQMDVNAYRSNNFSWFIGPRFAIAHAYVTKIANGLPISNGIFTVTQGQELGQMYMQSPVHSVDQVNPTTGARYIDPSLVGNYTIVNGNVVNKTTNAVLLTASNDLSYQGNATPKFTSSLINRFTIYKNLNVSFQFDWNHGEKVYNQTRQYLGRDRLSSDFDKTVTINGNTGAYVAYWNSFYNALNPLSSFVEDGSFIRLRDLSLSYDLTSLVHQKWLRSLVFTASGRNLITWTKYSGLDPEVSSAVNNQGGGLGSIGIAQGVDYFAQPNLKSYQFGFNIGF